MDGPETHSQHLAGMFQQKGHVIVWPTYHAEQIPMLPRIR